VGRILREEGRDRGKGGIAGMNPGREKKGKGQERVVYVLG